MKTQTKTKRADEQPDIDPARQHQQECNKWATHKSPICCVIKNTGYWNTISTTTCIVHGLVPKPASGGSWGIQSTGAKTLVKRLTGKQEKTKEVMDN